MFRLLQILFLLSVSLLSLANPGEKSFIDVIDPSRQNVKIDSLLKLSDELSIKNLDLSIEKASEALEKAKAINYTLGIFKAYYQLGRSNFLAGNYPKAMKYFFDAKEGFEKLDSKDEIALCLNQIGGLYDELGREEKEITKYFQDALRIYKQTKNRKGQYSVLNNLGLFYYDKSDYTKALENFELTIKSARVNSDSLYLAIALENAGDTYLKMQNLPKAKEYLELSLGVSKSIGDIEGMHSCWNLLAEVYLSKGEIKKALRAAKESLYLSEKLSSKNRMRDAYKTFYNIYKVKDDYNTALAYYEKYRAFEDSLFNETKAGSMTTLELKHQLKKQKVENEALAAQKELQIMVISRQKQVVIAAVIFIILVSIFAFVVYNKNKRVEKTNEAFRSKNEKINIQKEKIALKSKELSEKNKRLEELNQEKDSLMGIVAHDLKSPLNKLKGFVQLIELAGTLNDEQKEYVKMMMKEIESGRDIIQDLLDLNSYEQNDLNLSYDTFFLGDFVQDLIYSYIDQANKKGIKIHLSSENNNIAVCLDKRLLSRILDNLLSNAIKFSFSNKNVYVAIKLQGESNIEISVLDEGPGISQEEQKHLFKKFKKLSPQPTGGETSTGLGLAIAKTLTERMQGNILVDSKPGKGTKFSVVFPKFIGYFDEVESYQYAD